MAILAFDDQKLPLSRNLGDAFAVVCRFFGHTPSGVVSALSIDKKTARNALDGKAGVPVITKALQARQKSHGDHYELWRAMGEMIFGESEDEYDERRLAAIIEEATNVQTTVAARQARREHLRARASSSDSGATDRPPERRLA